MIERTLILIKPDGVQRQIVGKITSRFEDAGFKIIGMKMLWVNEAFAKKHYTEELAKRRGEHVRRYNINFLVEGPVIAIVLEGINAVDNVRKVVGDTEPKSALPGTIRGDFSHVSYAYADSKKMVIRNLIHASANKEDAEREIKLWFKKSELHSYKTTHESQIY